MSNVFGMLEYAEDTFEDESAESVLATALLSMLMKDEKPELLSEVPPEDFANQHIGEMWSAGRRLLLAKKAISKRTLVAERDTPAIRALVQRYSSGHVNRAELAPAVQSVREAAKGRRLVQSLKRVADRAASGASYSETLDYATTELADLAEASVDRSESFGPGEIVTSWREADRATRTVPTPWEGLNDYILGGLQPKRTYIVGARPGMGKSLMGLNLATHAAKNGYQTVLFSVEMPVEEVAARIIASEAQVPLSQVITRRMDKDTAAKVQEFEAEFRHWPLTAYEKPSVTIEYIASQLRAIKRNKGLDVVFIDYLQLLKESDSRVTREQQVAQMSRQLKQLSQELNCAIVIACQLNRSAATEGKKPQSSELRESGSLEQDADVILLLHRVAENGVLGVDLEVIIAKNRGGAVGTVTLVWRANQARLGN